MLNKVILMGRLVADPELRHTQSSIAVTSFRIAVDRPYRSGSGEDQQRQTDFIDVVAWRNTAEFVSKWFSKGKMIIVVGSIQTRTWTDKDGNKRYSVEVLADEVHFGESKRTESGGGAAPKGEYAPRANEYKPSPTSDFTELSDDDDELPF